MRIITKRILLEVFALSILLNECYKTVPLIFKETIGVLSAFELTVMVFRMGPTRLVSYFTWISPLSPGAMGASGFLGMVHPQEE